MIMIFRPLPSYIFAAYFFGGHVMRFLESTNSLLSGIVLPTVLITVGTYLAFRFRFFFFLHPVKVVKSIKNAGGSGGTSPFKAMTMALAGTLGVGNISGVATAIVAGGAGAVFWMWLSALAAMSLKYAEVYLAVRYRKRGEGGGYRGGAFYYMKEGLGPILGKKRAARIAAVFAALLVSNSILTGNIVQVNAAASVFEDVPHVVCGAAIAITVLAVTAGGAKRVGDFTVKVIPFLTALYVALSLYIIITNASRVGAVFSEIIRGAFNFRSASGGVLGYAVARAVRFGVTRGIFSNEAGCGTAPTAHASANVKSPHDQGCFGIFEVFCDTIVMCTMTALVILLAGIDGVDGIPLSMKSYGAFCGKFGEIAIGVAVIIFALATVICQEFYGLEALSFFGAKRGWRAAYIVVSFASTLVGSVTSPSAVWQFADLEIAVMTITNTLCVFILSGEVLPPVLTKIKAGFK